MFCLELKNPASHSGSEMVTISSLKSILTLASQYFCTYTSLCTNLLVHEMVASFSMFSLYFSVNFQLLMLSGHLKVAVSRCPSQDQSSPTPSPKNQSSVEEAKPLVLGLVAECRPMAASLAIVEMDVPNLSFTCIVDLDWKLLRAETRYFKLQWINLGPGILSFVERLSSLWRLKCTSIIEYNREGISKCVLYREVFYCVIFWSVNFRRFYSTQDDTNTSQCIL